MGPFSDPLFVIMIATMVAYILPLGIALHRAKTGGKRRRLRWAEERKREQAAASPILLIPQPSRPRPT